MADKRKSSSSSSLSDEKTETEPKKLTKRNLSRLQKHLKDVKSKKNATQSSVSKNHLLIKVTNVWS